MKRLIDQRGFSMMELVVVLAVIAILATLITPVITSYIDRARITKAENDVRAITAALVQFSSDTLRYPIRGPDNQNYLYLGSFGEDAADVWAGLSTNLDLVMNQNSWNFPTSGVSGWNGPYLETIGEDPWGRKYYVTVGNLGPNRQFAAFVLSAGPNQRIETSIEQPKSAAFEVGGDDIVHRLR
jgi:general secretion pathway protein G